MKIVTVNGNDYRLPNALNAFQQALYIHLIDWKWPDVIAAASAVDDAGLNDWIGWYQALYNV